jgi:hypothetical protein
VNAVLARAWGVVVESEVRPANLQAWSLATQQAHGGGHVVVLVSHGDVLQILQARMARAVCDHAQPARRAQTRFAHVSPTQHRFLPHLNTAELRKLSP